MNDQSKSPNRPPRPARPNVAKGSAAAAPNDKWANASSTITNDPAPASEPLPQQEPEFDRAEFIEQIAMQLKENPDLNQFRPRVTTVVDGRPSGGEIVGNGIVLHFSTHPMGQDGATFERIAQAIVARAYAEIVSAPESYSDEYLQNIERAIGCLGDFVVRANNARSKQFPI
ncbi:hypothetical protein UFOVP329_11 [uncultured Caudovirales phage]|uniref:Uncharacterized protein n=1 Tax=uncultured Caudovirales phage TaxID=2100421 RepID=A0A6J5M2V2_9CAUD|nr:hypothetical protein UFOVP329_11 [uncultured Caudovirales phage]